MMKSLLTISLALFATTSQAVQFGADFVNNGGGFIGVNPIPNVSLMYFW